MWITYKGETVKDERVKITLLLSDETLKLLREYAYDRTGKTNVSQAVMSMAKEYGKTKKET